MGIFGKVIGGLVGGVAGFFVGGPVGAIAGAASGLKLGASIDANKKSTKVAAQASTNAAEAEIAAQQRAIDFLRESRDLDRADTANQRRVTDETLAQVQAFLKGDTAGFRDSAQFKFAQEQGEQGINRFLNSRGLFKSGRAGKELARFNTGLAGQESDTFFRQLLSTANVASPGISNTLGNNRLTTAQVSNALIGQGDSESSGIVGSANAKNAGRDDLFKLLLAAPSTLLSDFTSFGSLLGAR